MNGDDEIIFTGAYKDFRLGIKFNLSGKDAAYAASALAFVSDRIEPYAFKFSGIDTGAIDAVAAPGGKGIGAACAFLEKNPPAILKEKLMKAVPKPELYSAAESCFINRLLIKAGLAFKAATAPAVNPDEEEIGDFIGFIGKYGTWVAIKKLGLENVRDYEVSGILSGINHTVVNKAFDFIGLKKDDAIIGAISGGKRRSIGNVALALRELEPKLGGGQDDAYLLCKVLEGIGYKPYASPEMLTDAYPDIKPPKMRGRKPKG